MQPIVDNIGALTYMLDIDPMPMHIDYEESDQVAEILSDDHQTTNPQRMLSNRWTTMHLSAKQRAFYDSLARFNVLPAGRRGGKSELAKRRGVRKAVRFGGYDSGWVLFTAPTHAQAKRIYWTDVKELTPSDLIVPGGISESELSIQLMNGCKLQVMGMDVAQRSEGTPLDHIVLDEYGDMDEEVWSAHIRPALTDRFGTADFIGVPEGRNHYYRLYNVAKSDTTGEWAAHHWTTAEVLHLYLGYRAKREDCLTPAEIEAYEKGDRHRLGRLLARRELDSAKKTMDELTFNQEYGASFVTFTGRIYYAFSDENVRPLQYNPELPLIFCFDFNTSPGVCVVVQEVGNQTHCIGEVYIENDSRTDLVCDKLALDYGHHKKDIWCYGDSTGGARHTTATSGPDWTIIENKLGSVFGTHAVILDVPTNPLERDRVNSMNSRIRSMSGERSLLVDPHACPHLIEDLEGVRVLNGSAGVIDKKSDPKLTHMTDALGYFVHARFPVSGNVMSQTQF